MKQHAANFKLATRRARGESRQYVTFWVGTERFGIEIGAIREVVNLMAIHKAKQCPDFIEGVIKLREHMIPVVDLRKRLGDSCQPETKQQRRPRILVFFHGGGFLGGIVDDFSSVITVAAKDIGEVPGQVVADESNTCVRQIAKIEEQVVMIVMPKLLLNQVERQVLQRFEELLKKECSR